MCSGTSVQWIHLMFSCSLTEENPWCQKSAPPAGQSVNCSMVGLGRSPGPERSDHNGSDPNINVWTLLWSRITAFQHLGHIRERAANISVYRWLNVCSWRKWPHYSVTGSHMRSFLLQSQQRWSPTGSPQNIWHQTGPQENKMHTHKNKSNRHKKKT